MKIVNPIVLSVLLCCALVNAQVKTKKQDAPQDPAEIIKEVKSPAQEEVKSDSKPQEDQLDKELNSLDLSDEQELIFDSLQKTESSQEATEKNAQQETTVPTEGASQEQEVYEDRRADGVIEPVRIKPELETVVEHVSAKPESVTPEQKTPQPLAPAAE